MTTDDLKALAINHPDEFTEWATLWHGDHDARHEDHFDCEIYALLNEVEFSPQELLNTVIDSDLDWAESWQQFLTTKNII